MNFALWLFTIKALGQTVDASKMMFDRLSEEEKEKLRKEYEEYSASGNKQGKKVLFF
mgnify:CR=1 FL=1